MRVVGPDGRPAADLEASGLDQQIENPITKVESALLNVTNLIPGESREVVARCVSKKLMGMAVVTEKDTGPVTLILTPWANLSGRLVDAQGKPLFRGLRIMLEDFKLPIHTVNGRNYDKQEFLIEPDGRFRIEGLVSGAKYRLLVIEGSIGQRGDITPDIRLDSGENRDLGDVKLMPKKNGN